MLASILMFLLHVMLIGSMVLFVSSSVTAALATKGHVERSIRFGAMFSGAMVVLGARAAGASYSEFISDAITSSGFATATLGVAVPGALGAGLGYSLLKAAYRGNIYMIRLMIFVAMLAGTQFTETYVYTIENAGFALSAAVVPNISFVVGMLLCIALTYDPADPDGSRELLRRIAAPSSPASADERRPLGADPR